MKKMNNKGFSLVELIIVIAIMAILVGVLAPQYLKYVEKSRRSADMDTLDSFYTACTTAAADPDVIDIGTSSSATTFTPGTTPSTWSSEVTETMGGSTAPKFKSKDSGGGSAAAGSQWPMYQTDAKGNYTVSIGLLTVSGR